MRESRSCKDPDLFRKVKESVTMQQTVEYFGLQIDRRGLCLCPFHQDKHPSMKIYPNGKGFYCFTCGAGGDQIKFAALYRGIRNEEAAKELAEAFHVPLQEPATYREKREAELARNRHCAMDQFIQHAKLFLQMYRILLCEARRDVRDRHFAESLQNLDHVDYLLECLDSCPEDVYKDQKAVRRIGEIEGRVIGWYDCAETDGTISG